MKRLIQPFFDLFVCLGHTPKDWPIGLRFCVLLLPIIAAITLISLYIGYASVVRPYTNALHQVSLIRPQVMAERMEGLLAQLRDSLLAVAQEEQPTAFSLQKAVEEMARQYPEIIIEAGIKEQKTSGILLLRHGSSFREIRLEETLQGPHAVFQQAASLPLYPGEVTLFPAVKAYYADSTQGGQLRTISVMRLATPLQERAGTVMVGIDLQKLQHYLTRLIQPGAPLQQYPAAEETGQLAYFFDEQGWILFEMHHKETTTGLMPDKVRQGFSGDLGRSGLETAFRPWAVHEYFWYMVKAVQSGMSGTVRANAAFAAAGSPANAFSPDNTVLAFSPVRFTPNLSGTAKVVGGVAFLEHLSVAQLAFARLWQHGLYLFVGLALFMLVVAVRMSAYIGGPLNTLATAIKGMATMPEVHVLQERPQFYEHQRLLAAANSLIGHLLALHTNTERLENEMGRIRAHLPVTLTPALAVPGTADLHAELGLVGSSMVMSEMRDQIRKAAKAGTDMLVWGETGTGKELVAEAIHQCSVRQAAPFISINCGALDENLLLDVLFGHTKGAFTEAKSDRKGAFLSAEGGTLHLDEIGNASPKVQQALLRALSVRRVRPLGADHELAFNVRVIAATNVDLRGEVKSGAFREDLYYRLAIITVHTPALRERRTDIPELAAYFLQEFAPQMDKDNLRLSHGALEMLMHHHWPGNVREFKNCVLRAIAFAEADIILPDHIVLAHHEKPAHTAHAGQDAAGGSTPPHAAHAATPAGTTPAAARPTGTTAGGAPATAMPGVAGAQAAYTVGAEQPKTTAPEPALPQHETPAYFNARQKKAWPAIVANGGISRSEYQVIAGEGVSTRTVQLDLKELVEWNMLERVGAGAVTRYTLIALSKE